MSDGPEMLGTPLHMSVHFILSHVLLHPLCFSVHLSVFGYNSRSYILRCGGLLSCNKYKAKKCAHIHARKAARSCPITAPSYCRTAAQLSQARTNLGVSAEAPRDVKEGNGGSSFKSRLLWYLKQRLILALPIPEHSPSYTHPDVSHILIRFFLKSTYYI